MTDARIRQTAPVNDRDLALLPSSVRDAARVLSNGEVMWPVSHADKAVEALAGLRRVVLGTDVRDYQPDGSFIEIAWSGFEPDGVDDAARGCAAALDALRRGPLPGDWVVVTWKS